MKLIPLLILLALNVSCNKRSAADRESERLHNLAASLIAHIHEETGVIYEVVHPGRYGGGYMVMKNPTTGELVAYEVGAWDLTMTSLDQFTGNVVRDLQTDKEWITSGHYEDEYGWKYVEKDEFDHTCACYKRESKMEYVVVGQNWVDTSHWQTFFTGGGLKFDNTSSGTKDLESIAALREQEARGILTQNLKSKYALSHNRAQELAGISYKYLRLENQRELTALEKDQFAKRALGVSLADIEGALLKKAVGNEAAYAEVLRRAAEVNRTSPEMIGKFFDEMIEL